MSAATPGPAPVKSACVWSEAGRSSRLPMTGRASFPRSDDLPGRDCATWKSERPDSGGPCRSAPPRRVAQSCEWFCLLNETPDTRRPQLRIMLVDDHELVRKGLFAVLSAVPEFEVVAEADDELSAIREAERSRPDVVVMDVRLGQGSGIEVTREIRARNPTIQVLMLTSFADDEALFASVMAGAAGYLLKQIRSGAIIEAIRAVGAGQSMLDPAVTKAVLDQWRSAQQAVRDEKLARLSSREERILDLIAKGRTNREIGEELHLAEKTVKNYVSGILAKLEVARRAEAAVYLAQHGEGHRATR